MSRISTSKPRSELTKDQQQAYDQIDSTVASLFGKNGDLFKYKADDKAQPGEGGFIGPFPLLVADLPTGLTWLDLAKKMGELPLPANAREIAILVAGAQFNAPYEEYAHGLVAQKKAGLSQEQVASIKSGQKPAGLDQAGSTAYDFAKQLMKPEVLPKGLWDAAVRDLGEAGTVGLIHYTGFYAYTCVILNALGAGVP